MMVEMVPTAQHMAERLGSPHSPPQRPVDEDEQRDIIYKRLDTIGHRVGQGLVER